MVRVSGEKVEMVFEEKGKRMVADHGFTMVVSGDQILHYRYEVQMLYASIGWSVGATLGYAKAATNKKVILCIGDGSFQVTVQDVSTMMPKSIIFSFTNIFCKEDLIEAIETATGEKKDCLCFIEVMTHKDDTSRELLAWGSRVATANSCPPNS
ncbi:pyruvate decarboxylase 2-like [Rutidosis leptorrhynchoides]|uniref:pyruvate decarboxylase 2-like n=1 Tax=Rutidosis leptorrhynchoides TaxID=125765 RepID=UPI003A9981C8